MERPSISLISLSSGRKYQYKGRRWKRVSAQAKAFVDDLLEMDVDDRATAEVALRASWLNRRHTATVRSPHSEEIDNVKRSIKRFAGYSKLRKVALMVVAHKSTSQEIGILRKVFQQYDIDGSGVIRYTGKIICIVGGVHCILWAGLWMHEKGFVEQD